MIWLARQIARVFLDCMLVISLKHLKMQYSLIRIFSATHALFQPHDFILMHSRWTCFFSRLSIISLDMAIDSSALFEPDICFILAKIWCIEGENIYLLKNEKQCWLLFHFLSSLSPYLQRICLHIIAQYLWTQQAHVIITYRMTRRRQRHTYRHCSITVQRTSCQHWQPASVITCHRCLCVPPGIQHVSLMDSHCYPVDMSANVSLSVIFCSFDTLYTMSAYVLHPLNWRLVKVELPPTHAFSIKRLMFICYMAHNYLYII